MIKFYKDKNKHTIIVDELTKIDLTDLTELKENTTDAALEKHVPVVTVKDNLVHAVVGEVLHPMTEQHYIEFIVLVTDKGYFVKYLTPNDKPEASFTLRENEKPLKVYESCNLHGIWVKNI